MEFEFEYKSIWIYLNISRYNFYLLIMLKDNVLEISTIK